MSSPTRHLQRAHYSKNAKALQGCLKSWSAQSRLKTRLCVTGRGAVRREGGEAARSAYTKANNAAPRSAAMTRWYMPRADAGWSAQDFFR
jgi:hypothetical protein